MWFFFSALLAAALNVNAAAQDKMRNEKTAEKPLVVLVRADRCGI